MPEIPPAAIMAAAAAIERELLSGRDYSMAQDSDEVLARVALEAAAPILAEAVARKITRHMEEHGPIDQGPDSTGAALRRAWVRHFSTAARVAAFAFSAEDDIKREAAEALKRGDFITCQIPEVPDAG